MMENIREKIGESRPETSEDIEKITGEAIREAMEQEEGKT